MLNRWSCIKGRNKKSLFYGKDSQKIQFCVAPLFHDNMMLGGYHLNADADADAVTLVVFTRSYTRRCKPSCPGQSCHPSLHSIIIWWQLGHWKVTVKVFGSDGTLSHLPAGQREQKHICIVVISCLLHHPFCEFNLHIVKTHVLVLVTQMNFDLNSKYAAPDQKNCLCIQLQHGTHPLSTKLSPNRIFPLGIRFLSQCCCWWFWSQCYCCCCTQFNYIVMIFAQIFTNANMMIFMFWYCGKIKNNPSQQWWRLQKHVKILSF